MTWLWLSFADPDLEPGTQFLGVAVVEGLDVVDGARTCHRLGINPGGEVLCAELPDHVTPPCAYTNRLLPRAEAEMLMAWVDRQKPN